MNAAKRERKLDHLRAKYAKAGGSPRKLRRLAEVKLKLAHRTEQSKKALAAGNIEAATQALLESVSEMVPAIEPTPPESL
jgi:predicted outer membrane protein